MPSSEEIATNLQHLKEDIDYAERQGTASIDRYKEAVRKLNKVREEQTTSLLRCYRAKEENIVMKSDVVKLRHENRMLFAEEDHNRRVIRNLVAATQHVESDICYNVKQCFFTEKQESNRNETGYVTLDHLTGEKIASMKLFLQELTSTLSVLQTSSENSCHDVAVATTEQCANMEAFNNELSQQLAILQSRISVVTRECIDTTSTSLKRTSSTEHEIKSMEHIVSNLKQTLHEEREHRDSDLKELLLRCSGGLVSRAPVVAASRELCATRKHIDTENARSSDRIALLQKRVKAKRRVLDNHAKHKELPNEILAIKDTLSKAEVGFTRRETPLRSGRLAKHVRFEIAKERKEKKTKADEVEVIF
eukprot:TRINITY_DN27859_c0_g1_i1.p1 TRINITY_DN27859_c0_g1~~TRINITY_DN27859_c0_g1_i1.p1  ORF type:complete len:372 (+),score=77.40 TRINITY_DN27859_c0_g1_i1:26-1117(+)